MNYEKNKKSIYCIGGANIDCKFKTATQLRLATSNPAKSFSTFGGVARNIADNLANNTQGISLQSVLGADQEAASLLAALRKKHVDVSHCVELADHSTARYYAILDENNELFIAIADMEIYDHIPFELFTQTWIEWQEQSIVFIDTNLPTHFIEKAIEISKQKNILLCIDPVSVEKSLRLPHDLNGLFLLKPNKDEASQLTGLKIETIEDCHSAGKILVDRGVNQVVISLGSLGYVVTNHDDSVYYKVEAMTEVVDANGAGDAFMSGIILGLQENLDIEDACQLGAKQAVRVIQSYASSQINDLSNGISLTDKISNLDSVN